MSESPWNVNTPRKRRAPQSIHPEGAQVRHVPRLPPAGARPQARQVGKPPQARLQETKPAENTPARRGGAAPRKRVSRPLAGLLVLCLVLAAAGLIQMLGRGQRLQALRDERAAQAQRALDHKREHWNARSGSGYMDLIRRYAAEYGISPSFVSAIIKCESSFRADAVSRVNARGLMQIMPDTGVWLAGRLKKADYQPDHLFDPETNIRFGVSYLAYLSDMFSGSPVMVAAAYHAGANNVKHWALGRAEDRKTIGLDQIPTADTRDYVRKVMDAYAIYFEQDQAAGLVDTGLVPDAVFSSSAGT